MTEYVISIDFGGTHLRAALVNAEGEIAHRIKRKTEGWRGPGAVLDRIADAIKEMRAMMEVEDTLLGAGVIAPGPSDPYAGVIYRAPNLEGWTNIPLCRELRERTGLSIWLGNDANLAGLAEHRYGAGRGYRHMIYITISTGIGGGVIINNQMLIGANGLAAEVGHMQIAPDGPLCGCGNRGCVEVFASGPNIARVARERLERGEPSSLSRYVNDEMEVRTEHVVLAAQAGDALALDVLHDAGTYIGMAVANLVHLYNPQRFILGGGVTNAGELIYKPIRETALARTISSYHGTFDIVPAALGDDVGLLGAAALAFDESHKV